jgi:hypothetical protein
VTTLAIDYSYADIPPKLIAEAGYSVVIGYLSPDPAKDLTAAKIAALHAVGLSVGLIWESTATRSLSGASAGGVDGDAAVAQARALGYGKGCVVFANVGDFVATSSQLGAIHAYYSAFAGVVKSEGYEPGGYGTGYIIDSMGSEGYVGVWWQNGINDEGVTGSVVSPNASLYQRTEPTIHIPAWVGEYDEDVVLKPFAVWGPATIPVPQPAPAPVSAPPFPGRLIELANPYMEGSDVMTWQRRMVYRGWTLVVDGVYGQITAGVCGQFQAQKKLTVDKIVGPVTWEAAWTAPITAGA